MEEKNNYEEKLLKPINGFFMLVLQIALLLLSIAGFIFSFTLPENSITFILVICCSVFLILLFGINMNGFKVIKPNEALVVTLFGKYKGTIRKEGFYYINPFSSSVNPGSFLSSDASENFSDKGIQTTGKTTKMNVSKCVSLKVMTLINKKQKINDEMGNPIEVGIVVVWRVANTAKACFNVENYVDYISTQSDSALRDVVRTYPYDISTNGDEKSLRGSSIVVAQQIRNELQKRVEIAGLEVIEARITHLAYATEIAAAMLQRQQASAIIEARQKIVEGAVGMVQMALDKLSKDGVCELDEERKAQMVSNLLVVLCGNKDAQPIVNSGTIY